MNQQRQRSRSWMTVSILGVAVQASISASKKRMSEARTVEAWARESGGPALGEVFGAVASAASRIAAKIRLAGLDGVYGAAGAVNVQGEQQQKLDVFANEAMTQSLGRCSAVLGVVSEEDDEAILFPERDPEGAHLVLSFDPLDGSSNIDVNVNVGTIFGVREVRKGEDPTQAVLQPGTGQIAAGYVVYGPSVVFVAAMRDGGAQAFTLNEQGTFERSASNLRMPEQGAYYSANEANAPSWPAAYRDFLVELRDGSVGGTSYSARYIGSLVADFHRTLLKGGVFVYPPTAKAPRGKLRLQYEANPLALIAEAAGGAATDGHRRILEVRGQAIHDRTPLVVGSRREVGRLGELVREAQP